MHLVIYSKALKEWFSSFRAVSLPEFWSEIFKDFLRVDVIPTLWFCKSQLRSPAFERPAAHVRQENCLGSRHQDIIRLCLLERSKKLCQTQTPLFKTSKNSPRKTGSNNLRNCVKQNIWIDPNSLGLHVQCLWLQAHDADHAFKHFRGPIDLLWLHGISSFCITLMRAGAPMVEAKHHGQTARTSPCPGRIGDFEGLGA